MSPRRTHFEQRAARLCDCATLECTEERGATLLRLRPHEPSAAGVVLYLAAHDYGTVQIDDPAAVPTELGEDLALDLTAIDHVIDVAVEGRATAYRIGRGGCVEESNGGTSVRSWKNAWPLPGWRRRADRFDYLPYR